MITNPDKAYDKLYEQIQKTGILESVSELLGWDQQTYMPPQALHVRSEQLALIASLQHKLFTQSSVGTLLQQIKPKSLQQQAQVREISFVYNRLKLVPNSLIEHRQRLVSKAYPVWQVARANNDLKSFLPHLKKLIDINIEYAHHIDPQKPTYQVLLQDYESDMTLDEIHALLTQVKNAIIPLIKTRTVPVVQVAVDKQYAFQIDLLKKIGYDFTKGRLDVSTHPFTSAGGRITTRFSEGWLSAISSTLHEAGHAFYEHGLDEAHFGTPLGKARSLSVHESQSRFWENHVGKSLEFMHILAPLIKQHYDLDIDAQTLYAYFNQTGPSLIRVNADELTYTLHIIIRFEIEKALFEHALAVEDVSQAWNQKVKQYLGIVVPDDTQGCLQDVHWADGLFGYFPTYAIGSILSAQIAQTMSEEFDLNGDIKRGQFERIHNWLTLKIHKHGQLYTMHDLIQQATGKQLSAQAYIQYLTKKFT